MSDTIDLPAFGLTLERHPTTAVRAYMCYPEPFEQRAYAALYADGWYVTVDVRRAPRVSIQYASFGAPSIEDACERLIAQMTPDDVAAIRALGER